MTESKESRRKSKEQIENRKDPTTKYDDGINDSKITSSEYSSLGALIVWNISKVLEKNPTLDVKEAINEAQNRLEQVSANDGILSEQSQERYLACALLAWQQLGHNNANSLCRFFEIKKNEDIESKPPKNSIPTAKDVKLSYISVPYTKTNVELSSPASKFPQVMDSSSRFSHEMGPVVKLPIETKVVMRMENAPCSRPQSNKPKAPEKNVLNKIEKACCMDSECLNQLKLMDATTKELRSRAGLLAHREAERAELLERAEAAWKDLETGYQRRLTLAEEKEDDIFKQITKLVEERNMYKDTCTSLGQKLKDKKSAAEKKRTSLIELEKVLCERACQRMKLCEESSKGDSLVTEHSCRIAQLERDLLFKEEEEQRNAQSLRDEVESARALCLEAERALRAELGALRDQIADVSKQLLEEDSKNETIKNAVDVLRQEKMGLVEDLEGCKALCDGRMQGMVNELNNKKEELNKLKKKVIECRCKMPVHVAVEVKRTPSFAALCKCTPEETVTTSCSCTSMRTKVLSNLLEDLFGGLRFELSGWVTQMPCQLLKCLEDKHNWERSSAVKTSLRNFFACVIGKELDIAITTSIEDYHIRWAGPSCVDKTKPTDPENENWQERAIECRAQLLASQLAEQLFKERAEEIRAKNLSVDTTSRKISADKRHLDKTSSNSDTHTTAPVCDCNPAGKVNQPCSCDKKPVAVYWHQTMQDVTKLRQQVDDLKKDYLKKDDLKTMEDKFAQIIQLSPTCCPPERDRNEGMKQKPVKRPYGRVASPVGNARVNDRKVKNVAVNETAVFPCLVKNAADNEAPSGLAPNYWQRAIQDFTRLRLQIEELKKNSIKKQDLKLMEDKIAEIVHRASGGTVPPSAKVDCSTSENIDNEATKKEQNSNKADNVTELQNSDFNNKPNAIKKVFEINRQTKKGYKRKPIQKNVVEKILKPNTKNDRTYAVNMCLCGRKTQQLQAFNEKNKVETSIWKQKLSKDAVSQLSSSIRQAKPINESLFSQDMSARTHSKESEEQSCASNCVCFHKVPSNTSIDKLLDTLAKWKVDLDEPIDQCTEKCILKSFNAICRKSPDENDSVKSSYRFEDKLEKDPMIQKQEYSSDAVTKHSSLEESNESKRSKCSEKVSMKSTGFICTTDSEYIGTVNLDKSNEEICKCCIETKANNNTPFKCITSNKCSCEKNPEVRKQEEEIVRSKKENHQDINIIQAKPERRALKNTFKSKLSHRRLQSPDKQTSNLNTLKENVQVFAKSDYQIKFLGVTLADTNSHIKNQVSHKNNDDKTSFKSLTNTLPQKGSEISSSTTSAKNIQNSVYRAKTSNPIPEFSEFSNSSNTDKDKEEEIRRKVFSVNENTNKEDEQFYDKLKTLLGYTEKPSVTPLENSKFEHNELEFTKTSSDQDISKKTTTDASRSVSIRVTKSSDQDGAIENVNIKKHLSSPNKIITKSFSKQKVSCECGLKFDEFKRFIDVHFSKKIVNEDVALDVQSFKDFKYSDESCVCCNKLNTRESKDLEDNAFHLLEEFLKKKLGEFKALSSCYSCVPQEQEEKIFTIILQRVKQLIIDSTNEITCKCTMDEQQSQGSWKRAYGLLQEYIKMKIKKVQCSCFLADNKEAVLPDVLEKVCQLIDNDFKRLKGVYGSMNDLNSQDNAKKNLKQVNFDAGVTETNAAKNADVVLLTFKDKISDFFQTTQDAHVTKSKNTINVKQSMPSQAPIPLSMEIKSGNLLNAFINNIKAENTNSQNNEECALCDNKVDVKEKKEDTQKNSLEMVTDKYTKNKQDLPLQQTEVSYENKNDTSVTKKDLTHDRLNENVTCLDKNKSKLLIPSDVSGIEDNLDEDRSNPIIYNTAAITVSNEILTPFQHISVNNGTICDEKLENVNKKCFNIPYIGYTIDCSCNDSLGACICPKPISKVDTDAINTIWKNSKPDETYFKMISYIIHNNPKENTSGNTSLPDTLTDDVHSGGIFTNNVTDNHFEYKECETTCSKNADLVLIKSVENNNVIQNHATTNTFDENTSLDIVYSVNDDILDSCECSSHYNSSQKQSNSERLKNYLYFPVPLRGFEQHLRDDPVSNKNLKSNLQAELRKHTCDCEKIPICHVKMLVENIESKLANADCTCDSLLSKVCPVHASAT